MQDLFLEKVNFLLSLADAPYKARSTYALPVHVHVHPIALQSSALMPLALQSSALYAPMHPLHPIGVHVHPYGVQGVHGVQGGARGHQGQRPLPLQIFDLMPLALQSSALYARAPLLRGK